MFKILLVEDNLADQRLAIEAFRNSHVACDITITSDGRQALTVLEEQSQKLPDLILLDLNLPRLDGRQVLRQIKNRPEWRHIPVLMLSSSTSPQDIAECYELQANCYLIKPMDIDRFFDLIRKVEELWFPQVAGMANAGAEPGSLLGEFYGKPRVVGQASA